MRFGWGRNSAQRGLVGIDLAGGCAFAQIERQRGQKPRLVASDFLGGEAAASVRELKAERQRLKLGKTPCSTLLDAQDYQLLLVEAPRVDPSELRAAVRWRVKDLIDFHIDDAVIDVFEIPGQQQRAQGQVMMYAVVARASAVRQRIELIEGGDLKLAVVDIPELALRNIAALSDIDANGAVTVKLDERGGLVVVTRQYNLFLARRFEIGTNALRTAAEESSEPPDEARYGPIADLLDSIVLEIQRSIDYYDRHFHQPPLAGLLLAPPGPDLDWLDVQLFRRLGLPVKRLDLNDLLDCAQPLDATQQNLRLMAIGAALRDEETSL